MSKRKRAYKSKWHNPLCEDAHPLLVDNGTHYIKSGFAGDSAPRAVFPPIVGTLKRKPKIVGMRIKQHYVGDEAQSKRGLLNLQRPIHNGIIQDFDAMEKIWHHTFYNELRICPEEHPMVLSESPLNPKENRRKTTQIMFETFNVPGIYLAATSIFALYASARTSGVVLNSGDTVSHSVPIYEGYILRDHVQSTYIGGRTTTQHLVALLNDDSGIHTKFETSTEHEIVRDIKERLCSVAIDYDKYIQSAKDKRYELPDGTVIALSDNRLKCTECLFEPAFIGHSEYDGIHDILFNSIKDNEYEVRKEMYQNIVLEGGNTMFDGFSDRLMNELKALISSNDDVLVNGYIRRQKIGNIDTGYISDTVNRYTGAFGYKIKIVAPPERKYSVWIGASILASTINANELFVTMKEYNETGADIINRKCF